MSVYADKNALMMFYHAHIMSHINLASYLWDGAKEVHLIKLNSLHRRAAKIIAKGCQVSTDEKQNFLNMLPLAKQFMYNKGVFMYKVYSNTVPKYVSSLFRKAPTRLKSMNFNLPRTRIDLVKRSFAFSGASVWNSLSLATKNSPSLNSFPKFQ